MNECFCHRIPLKDDQRIGVCMPCHNRLIQAKNIVTSELHQAEVSVKTLTAEVDRLKAILQPAGQTA